jgi:hypothetical protein
VRGGLGDTFVCCIHEQLRAGREGGREGKGAGGSGNLVGGESQPSRLVTGFRVHDGARRRAYKAHSRCVCLCAITVTWCLSMYTR